MSTGARFMDGYLPKAILDALSDRHPCLTLASSAICPSRQIANAACSTSLGLRPPSPEGRGEKRVDFVYGPFRMRAPND